MKAIVYHKYGSPDVLRMEDIQKPIPGDDEVLVKICAVSITDHLHSRWFDEDPSKGSKTITIAEN